MAALLLLLRVWVPPLPLPCLLAVAAVRLGTGRCFLYFGRLLGPSAVYLHRVRLVYFRLIAAALGYTESTQNQLSSSRLLFAAVKQPCC